MSRPTWVQVRGTALFLAGLMGVAYETLVGQADRPTLLITFAAMMGLPLFLKADETKALLLKETAALLHKEEEKPKEVVIVKAARHPQTALWIVLSIALTAVNTLVESKFVLIVVLAIQLCLAIMVIHDARKRQSNGKR